MGTWAGAILGAVANKPRILLGPKDLIWSLIPLIAICLVIAGISARCSFHPGGPSAGPVPSFDARNGLRADAHSLPFAVRDPQIPAGWQPNSGSHATIPGVGDNNAGGGKSTTVGYITDGGRYLKLLQTNATEDALARFNDTDLNPTGTEQVAGHSWVVYSAPTKESAWITDLDGVRVLISGAGSQAEYTALATAVAAAAPLPK